MPKFIDKMNLPQYRFFNDMIKLDEERRDLVSDAIAGGEMMKSSDKKDRLEGLYLFERALRRIPQFLYRLEKDQKQCKRDLAGKNKRQQEKRLEEYINILLMLPFYQGMPLRKDKILPDDLQEYPMKNPPVEKYTLDKATGKYCLPYVSVPKLLIIEDELFLEMQKESFTNEILESLENLLVEDVHYIICIQCKGYEDTCYLVELKKEPIIQTLDNRRCSDNVPFRALVNQQNDLTTVLLCLQDYLQEMELIEKRRRKYNEEHPDSEKHKPKERLVPSYVDKNAIRIFDLKGKQNAQGYEGGVFYLGRHGGSATRKTGYEMSPHTRKGHYRTYQNGKTVYVKSSIIHKEKYEGIQSAHRINQKNKQEEKMEEQLGSDSGPTLGMNM